MDEAATASMLTYKGRKYDMSRWMKRHPGGAETIEYFLETDATVPMHMFHDMNSPMVQKWLPRFDRGPDPERPLREFDKDYLALEQQFIEKGWFKPSLPWFIYKTVLVVAYLVAALLVSNPWLKGLLLGLFIHQGAFLAHDTCHDAAFPRRIRERMGWFFGTVCFGLNHGRWTREHNLHHLLNNRPLQDPQINNLPEILYSSHEVEAFEREKRPLSVRDKKFIAYSYRWLLPVLFFYGRANAIRAEVRRSSRTLRRDRPPELKREARFYLWGAAAHVSLILLVTAVGIYQNGLSSLWPNLFVIPVVALGFSGILHLQLILSHGHRPRLYKDEQEELGMKIQIVSNQNIRTNFLNAWFHGGLDNHIEHHLFPRIPRHNLVKIRPYVRELCAKHELPYHSDGFIKAVYLFITSLKRESAAVRAELRAPKTQMVSEA